MTVAIVVYKGLIPVVGRILTSYTDETVGNCNILVVACHKDSISK